MKLLDRYIMRAFIIGVVPVMLLLLILFGFQALAEELELVGKGLFTTFDAFMVVLNTMPRRMTELLPVSALLGGLMGLGAMASHQELIAARAAGMSRQRIALPVLLVSILLAVFIFLAQTWAIPLAERHANNLRAKTLLNTAVDHVGDIDFWVRSGSNFVRVNQLRYGQLLYDVEIFVIDEQGWLGQLVEARQAVSLGNNDWMLSDVRLTSMERLSSQVEQREEMVWPGLLSADQAAILMMPLESLAPQELLRLIEYQRENDLDTQPYRIIYWQQISLLLSVVGMGLLALPLLLGSIRSISAGQRVVIGGFIGISFYLIQQLRSSSTVFVARKLRHGGHEFACHLHHSLKQQAVL
jgi:lipopolysaccharide export system permease protein